VQAVIDIRADQCSGCGEPLSESLRVAGKPDPVYTAMVRGLRLVQARERVMAVLEKKDQQDEKTRKIFRSARHWVMKRLN
jgi:hypothetical protein